MFSKGPRRQLTMLTALVASAAMVAEERLIVLPEEHATILSEVPLFSRRIATAFQKSISLKTGESPSTCTARLQDMCRITLASTTSAALYNVSLGGKRAVYVKTGDIDQMWIRDSTAQISQLINHAKHLGMGNASSSLSEVMKRTISGVLYAQCFYIQSDPYANSFWRKWHDPSKLSYHQRVELGQGNYTASRNYELDSNAYFLQFAFGVAHQHLDKHTAFADLYAKNGPVHNTSRLIVNTWLNELNHDTSSPYNLVELPRKGKGTLTEPVGLIFSAFRPSDDQNKLGYSIPSNIFAGVQLNRLSGFAKLEWDDDELSQKAKSIFDGISSAIQEHGISEDGTYCYETDGMGGCIKSDDAVQPSLLGLPLYDPNHLLHDKEVYDRTRRFVLSNENVNFHCPNASMSQLTDTAEEVARPGARCGIGSEHTPGNKVWPLATVVQMATSEDKVEKDRCLSELLEAAERGAIDGVPTLHQAHDVDDPSKWTRRQYLMGSALFSRYACGQCYNAEPAIKTKIEPDELPASVKPRKSASAATGAELVPHPEPLGWYW